MANALLVTEKEIEKFGNKDPEEAKRIEKCVQEITDLIWNDSKTRKKVVKEFFKLFESENPLALNYEKLYGLMGRIMDDSINKSDELGEILEKYDLI